MSPLRPTARWEHCADAPTIDSAVSLNPPVANLRFFMTAAVPCPYLPDRSERKVFAVLPAHGGAPVNDVLTVSGFRRSQGIAYRPACDACEACMSVRIPVDAYTFSRSERRALERNAALTRALVEAEATREQFDLIRRYLERRHAGQGMHGMTWFDYVAMVEQSAVRTHLIEYREPSPDGGPGELVAVTLVDMLNDGLSLVYSFYAPEEPRRSLGRFAILDHVQQARAAGLPYVYLGYWVPGSPRMAYKSGLRPLEILRMTGWSPMTERERLATAPLPAPRRDPAEGLPVARGRRLFGS